MDAVKSDRINCFIEECRAGLCCDNKIRISPRFLSLCLGDCSVCVHQQWEHHRGHPRPPGGSVQEKSWWAGPCQLCEGSGCAGVGWSRQTSGYGLWSKVWNNKSCWFFCSFEWVDVWMSMPAMTSKVNLFWFVLSSLLCNYTKHLLRRERNRKCRASMNREFPLLRCVLTYLC